MLSFCSSQGVPMDVEIVCVYLNGISDVEGMPLWQQEFAKLLGKTSEVIDG